MRIEMRSITGNLDSELKEINEKKALLAQWHEVLVSDDFSHTGGDYKGWARLPSEIDPEVVVKIARTAEEIRQKCSLLVVVCFLQVQIPEICRQKWRILHLRFGESCRLPGRIT